MFHQAFQRFRSWRGWPVVVLVVLATIIPEILTGSTTVSYLGGLPIEMGLYGCGALLIREVVRRRGGGWLSMLMFGVTYAAIEEGLLEPTWLTPQMFPGHHYGVAFGVFWPYAAYNTGLHAIWSITLPILLTETLFRGRRREPWLGITGITVAAVVFLLDAAFTEKLWHTIVISRTYGVRLDAGPAQYLGVASLAVVMAVLGWRSTTWKTGIHCATGKVPSPWGVGSAAAAGALLWFGIMHLPDAWTDHMPIPAFLMWQFAIATTGYLLVREWASREGWNDRHRLAVFAGAIGGEVIGGYWMLHRTGATLVLQICTGTVAVVALAILAARTPLRSQSPTTPAHV